jgi:hypothetical protein
MRESKERRVECMRVAVAGALVSARAGGGCYVALDFDFGFHRDEAVDFVARAHELGDRARLGAGYQLEVFRPGHFAGDYFARPRYHCGTFGCLDPEASTRVGYFGWDSRASRADSLMAPDWEGSFAGRTVELRPSLEKTHRFRQRA